MDRLNNLLSLHERTKLKSQKHGRRGLSERLYVREYEINRIGRNYDDVKRNDICTELILVSLLARNIYINEKFERGEYLFIEDYNSEIEFNKGLWLLFTVETMNEFIPMPDLPKSYDEIEQYIKNKEKYSTEFSIYKTANEIVMFNTLRSLKYCTTFGDFDLHCCLPSGHWTIPQHNASGVDKRNDAPQRLIQVALGLYIYDSNNEIEPYAGFWLKRAEQAINKSIALYTRALIVRFRNAAMYEQTPRPERFVLVENYNWNIPRNRKAY